MKKITIMLVLIISMNIITPVLANETEVTTDIYVTMAYEKDLYHKTYTSLYSLMPIL